MSDSVALLEGDRSRHKCLEPKVLCPLLVSIGEMRKSPTAAPPPFLRNHGGWGRDKLQFK